MNQSILTISFQRGRRGTFIAKVMEVPAIVVRGNSPEEVRTKVIDALAHHQKEVLANKQP